MSNEWMNRLARISISTRLFLAVLAVATIAVSAAGIASHHSFTNGFLGYLNRLAIERMESALPRLQAAHAQNGSWDFLRQRPGEWIDIMIHDGASKRSARNMQPSVSDLTGAFLRVTLLDADHNFVIGFRNYTNDRIERPVVVNGETVGWLSLAPFQSVIESGAQSFERAQRDANLLIYTGAILLAAAIAWWLARAVLRPIRRVADATHELAGGNYAQRVPEIGGDEVARLAHDFNHLATTLERNEEVRRNFMADISHELRTPLGILHGELEALEDGLRPLDQVALKSLQAEVRTLNKLVTDLYDLSLADIAALSYRKANVDLAICVTQAAAGFQSRAGEHGLTLECHCPDTPAMVFADADRLQQLLVNLFENSCRYTDAGGLIKITLNTENVDGKRFAVLRCEDSAPGVPVDLLPRLFERFYRVEASRSRVSGGAGLGLAICRNIVQAHDGNIDATPSVLGGLSITIRLPLTRRL